MNIINRVFTLALFSLSLLYSCKKPQNNPSAENKTISSTMSFSSNMPTLENGILTFQSQEQFTQYTAYLDSIIDPANYDSATLIKQEFDQDEILENIERSIGFVSIRKISHDNFMQMNQIGWDNLRDIPEEHFIHDATTKSILNADRIVKIGDSYVRYITKDLSVMIDASQLELLEAFKKLLETSNIYEALNIDPTHRYSTLFEVSGTGKLFTYDKNPSQPLSAGDLSIIGLQYESTNCNNPLTLTFLNMQLWQELDGISNTNGSLDATFVVNFGDGTPLQTYYSTYNPSHSAIVPNFPHTYSAAGTYQLQVQATAHTVYAGATSTTATYSTSIVVISTTCRNDLFKQTEDEFHFVPDGSRAWSGKISVIKTNAGSNWKTRVFVETSSWLKNGNKWKQSKAEIWHNLHTERRNSGCGVLGQEDGDGWASSAKHIQTHRTNDLYYWSTISTMHGINYHDTWLYFNKALSVCP